MSYDQIYNIAANGMRLEKLRVDVVANNIANQHSLQTEGSQFQPLRVLATAKPFDAYLADPEANNFANISLVPRIYP